MSAVEICLSIIETTRTLIESDTFRLAYRIGNSFSRNRKLIFSKLIYFLLHQSKKASTINIVDFLEDFPQLEIPFISKQAVSKARKGIHHQAFAEFMRVSTARYYELQNSAKKWHDYFVFAIDGTTLQMPQTPQNLLEFGSCTNQSGSKFVMASASLLYDVLNDIIIDAQLNVCNYSERKFALEHLVAFNCLPIKEKSIFIFDRGYPSFDMYRKLTEQKRLFVMRLKKRTLSFESLDTDDEVIDYGPKYPKEDTTRLRVVKIHLDTEDEILITNIFDKDITPDMFKELYFLRWGIEGKIRELKERFQIEDFSGCSPSSIRQDFYISMFFSNLVSLLKAEADFEIRKNVQSTKGEYSYQSNRSFIISRLKRHLVKILIGIENAVTTMMQILMLAQKMRSQVRSNRKYERKIRQPKRKHHHNRKPCL